jgi:hypothetical protein
LPGRGCYEVVDAIGAAQKLALWERKSARFIESAMNLSWSDLNKVQEAGDYPFRDGTITVTFAELAIWKKNPGAQFQLMRRYPRSVRRPKGSRPNFNWGCPMGSRNRMHLKVLVLHHRLRPGRYR